ncbi:hypothetical protein RLEG12_03745 (plasmid) [Rhizobium leguminosarum bv. trifolii CB782]|nr:hypothetical protein RLEG12_03745 [Rhizobium leguminosarum bv. trifolii CB782]
MAVDHEAIFDDMKTEENARAGQITDNSRQ